MSTLRLSTLLAGASLAVLALATAPLARAQGSLTPPAGPPAPTMKSLDQIEARTPLGTPGATHATTITIAQPGSYYLVGPLSPVAGDGIVITADGVTLDLNGFTISSPGIEGGASGAGVRINSTRDVTVRNGHIRGVSSLIPSGQLLAVGFRHGVAAAPVIQIPAGSVFRQNLRVENISVHSVHGSAIDLGGGATLLNNSGTAVVDCQVYLSGGFAIAADLVTGCTVHQADEGIAALLVSDCRVSARGLRAVVAHNVDKTYAETSSTLATAIGISAVTVSNSTGMTGGSVAGATGTGTGIKCEGGTVSFSRGKGASAIVARIIVASTSAGGVITGAKQLGTP